LGKTIGPCDGLFVSTLKVFMIISDASVSTWQTACIEMNSEMDKEKTWNLTERATKSNLRVNQDRFRRLAVYSTTPG
jgi:hypothetical protein